ncbi:MAG: hypothetical protein HYZ15_03300 [Sphingobacteriales bacterium]|nr:hypothetical protein [Sphingobacteriales bacterium]
MSKSNQASTSNVPEKASDGKAVSITKIDISGVKNGRETSQAPPKPEKPVKGNK